MELKDIDGKLLEIGDKIVYEDYGSIFIGFVVKLCGSTLKVAPTHNSSYCRQIQHRSTNTKIFKIPVVEDSNIKSIAIKAKEHEVEDERFAI